MAESEFKTAAQLRQEQLGMAAGLAVAEGQARDVLVLEPSEYVIAPVVSVDQARALWNSFLQIRGILLEDPACFDVIGESKEMNRTGATRLATAFGLSIEQLEIGEGRVQEADTNEYDYRFLARIRVSKGARHVDGVGSCRISEIPAKSKRGEPVPYSQREHFALTKAWTRATKRAIADILGGTEAE